MSLYRSIDRCRACGSDQLAQVLNLGQFCISDFLESRDAFTDRAPLVLVRCENCTLVQLRDSVDRERLYRHYWYRSGTQPAMVSALQDVVRDATQRVPLLPDDVVIDIGANDGTLLREYEPGIWKVAFEPAQNFDPGADERYGYWPKPEFKTQAKIITSAACFYDVDDPNAFVAAVKENLAPDGVWINQLAYLPDTVATNNFGDICHEHLTYWTISAFSRLCEQHGLYIQDCSHNDVNGGSIRFVMGHRPQVGRIDPKPMDLDDFRDRINRQRHEVLKFLVNHTGIIGYGASTKGNTYLQYWGVTANLVDLIADRNPDKWGKYTPMGQRVISEEQMRAMRPPYLLVLPWHFTEAFVERERDLLMQGARLIVPFPKLHLIGGDQLADLQQKEPLPDSRAAV